MGTLKSCTTCYYRNSICEQCAYCSKWEANYLAPKLVQHNCRTCAHNRGICRTCYCNTNWRDVYSSDDALRLENGSDAMAAARERGCYTCGRLDDGTSSDPVSGCKGCMSNLKNWKPKGGNPMPTVIPAPSAPKPSHYVGLDPDVIAFCLANDIGFCEGNVIKYVCRWKDKGHVADLRKARDYLDRLIRQQTEHDHA